jgi:hypothetical protein
MENNKGRLFLHDHRAENSPWEPESTSSGIGAIILIEGTILLAGDQNMFDGIGPGNWRWCIEITSIKCPNVERQPRSCQPAEFIKDTTPGLTAIQKLLQVHETCLFLLLAATLQLA